MMAHTGQTAPGLETWLLWSLLTLIGGVLYYCLPSLLHIDLNFNPTFANIWLAFPLFFVVLGQWLILRGLVAGSGWWFLTNLLGFFWAYLYLISYAFLEEYTSGKSLLFGTQTFWTVTWQFAVLALVFGAIVGLVQGLLVLRQYGTGPTLLSWVGANALAWGIGWPLGQQVFRGVFRIWFPVPPINVISESVMGALATVITWGTIGMITGAAFVWLGRR